jgi:hypothetical protein
VFSGAGLRGIDSMRIVNMCIVIRGGRCQVREPKAHQRRVPGNARAAGWESFRLG